MKISKQIFVCIVMLTLMIVGIKTQAVNASYDEALSVLAKDNIDAVNDLIGDFQCPNVYDRPYSSLATQVKDVTVGCTIEGRLSYSGAVSVETYFHVGKDYIGTYVKKWCKDDNKRKVCCEVAEQGAWLLNMEEK